MGQDTPDADARSSETRLPASGPDATAALTLSPDGFGLFREIQVVVTDGPDAGKRARATSERLVIGSASGADLVLTDSAVSRFHCELRAVGTAIVVRDLGSRNGTRIEGVFVREAYLEPGARLTLGRTTLRFEVGDAPVRVPLAKVARFGTMVGQSSAMRRVFDMLERAARSDATVLLEGETGTGKEAAAESLHAESSRKDGPFLVVDCGAIPANLLESELFGHEKGAFTGAHAAREGIFGAARGGTVFLDEIGELPLELQPKLLRVLEKREIKPVGRAAYEPVDVRVVAATNRDLRTEVNDKRFRSDLFYRLAIVEVRLPPLRERLDDLPLLVDALLAGSRGDSAPFTRSDTFQKELAHHRWPGNVRELRNHLDRCIALQQPMPFAGEATGEAPREAGAAVDVTMPLREARDRATADFERRYLDALLASCSGNVSAAARAAAVDRAYFYRLLWKHGLRATT
ncbi:MAG: sigma 54-dependent Fis family transcriptional regulator [Labilithrix sp.]|nr:sigma 54-dependent Fis family transcriptional regulator [Labilithrix sp.]